MGLAGVGGTIKGKEPIDNRAEFRCVLHIYDSFNKQKLFLSNRGN